MNRARRAVAVLGVLAVAGCTRAPSVAAPTVTAIPAASTPEISTQPATVVDDVPPPASTAGTAVLDAARSFAAAQCSWSWRDPRDDHVTALAALATPTYAALVARQSSAVRWRTEVVTQRQVVTCRITDARLAGGAPPVDGVAYARVSTISHVESTVGSFDTGLLQRSWRLELAGGRWLVAGPFAGG